MTIIFKDVGCADLE